MNFMLSGTLNQASETEDYPEPPAYTQDASGAPQVEAHWYPAAHFTDKWFAHPGISGGYQMVLGVNPTTVLRSPDGTQSETVQLSQSQNLWFAGLEGRIPVGSLPLRFLVTARYSQHTFELSGDDQALDDAGELVPAPAASPDFLYQSIEMGGDVEWRPAQLILGGHARYVQVLNAGGVQDADWFPNTSALAVDLGVRAGWAISPVFDLLVGFDSRMYGMDFNPIPDTQPPERIAGGATDRYLGVWLALGVNWPSDEPKSAESGGAAGGADSFDSFD